MEDKQQKIKKSLRYSILDGSFYSAMVGFGESFFSAFAVFLKANNLHLGILGSLPQTLGSIIQLYSDRILNFLRSRKKMVLIGVLLQALMYVPIAFVFFYGTLKIYHLIFFICLYWIFGSIINPAWNSWMGDLVNEKERGSYFGTRNKISGFVSFITFIVGGYILEHFSGNNPQAHKGFMIIFVLAFFSRLVSAFYLSLKYEPEYKILKEEQFSFIDFIRQARFRNYGLFVIYLSLMNFAVFLSAPFFTPYMLNDLHMDYTTFTIVIAASLLVKFLMMPVWGRLSDTYGTKKVLVVTGFLMPIVPLLWLFSSELWYLIVIQAYNGFIWAGFEIASFNFIFDTTTAQKRATCVAYYNVLNGIAIFIGAIIGALIVRYNEIFFSKYLLIFFISFVMRYLVSIAFIPKLKEVRTVESISYSQLLFKALTIKPTQGIVYNIVTLRKKKR